MSKLYNKYKKLKEKDNKKCYLFKVGVFYVFLDEDANKISNLINLKLTRLTDDIKKCGFPVLSSEKYFIALKNLGIDYEIIEDYYTLRMLLNKIKKLEVRDISLDEAYLLINKLHVMLNNE